MPSSNRRSSDRETTRKYNMKNAKKRKRPNSANKRVRAKFLDGYSKNMTDREENNTSRDYKKYDDEDDLDDKAEAFASRVKRNSKGKRFK